MNKKLIRLTESDLHKIVKESVDKILKEMEINKTLDEDTEGYNQVMSVLNKPIWQEKLKKAWEKEKLTNPNPDWDTFEYNFALRCLDKEREEDAKAQRKKDPMNQWFKDFDAASKHRENMEYIENGGREPNKHRKNVAKALKKPTNEGIENETRFLPHLKRTYENLYREYEHWQYATYKPQGMDDAINAIIAAMHSVQDIIREIEPNDNIPTWEDPQQY